LSVAPTDGWLGEPLVSTDAGAALVAALDIGVMVHGPDGVVRGCNAALPQILGSDAAELLGSRFESPRWRCVRVDGGQFDNDDRPAAVTLRTGEPTSAVVMGVRRSDGTVVWVSVSTAPITAGPQDAPLVVASFVDVTERHTAEVHGARIERQLQAVLAVAPVGLFTANAGGRLPR
jgi:PAS domain S-box-containing protein